MSIQFQHVRFDLAGQMLKPRFIDGQELPDWQQGPGIVDYVRHMAQEWWLLTSGNSNSRELVFKRQAP